MEEQLLQVITQETYTLTRLKSRVRILKNFLIAKIFQSQEQIDADLSAEDQKWLSALDQNTIAQINKDNVYELFTSIEKKIDSLPVIVMYLPFDAPEIEVAKYGTKARQNFGTSILLDIKYDPTLIAGCALVWKGVYKDYSIKSVLKEKHDEIMSSFRETLNRY